MIDITVSNFEYEVERARGLVVIDLYAEWCGPCKMLAVHLESLEAEYPSIKFARINVDLERRLAELFHVSSIPMIALVMNGVFLDFSVGYVEKDELLSFINKYI